MPIRFLGYLALLLFTAAPAAHAQFAVLPYAGYDFDGEAVLIGLGAEVALPLAAPVALSLRPSGEYLLPKDLDIGGRTFGQNIAQVNLDVIARLRAPGIQPYAGVGVGVRLIKLDTSDNDDVEGNLDIEETNVGANLLGGVVFGGIGPVQPFVQGRLTVGDGSAFAVFGGLRVGL